MELWRRVWRHGIVKYLSAPALIALREGLVKDDPKLVQGVSISPPEVDVFYAEPVYAACAVGYGPWQAGEATTVQALAMHTENVLTLADLALKEPGIVRFFLNWYDEAPRGQMRRELVAEINVALAQKAVA